MNTSLKKIFFAVALISFASCKNEELLLPTNLKNETKEFKSLNYKGLNALMPVDFPEELVNYNAGKLEEIGTTNLQSLSKRNVRTVGGKKTLTEIIDAVYAKYPSFDEFNPKEYKKFFPKLSEKEIIENSETVIAYVEKLMGYEVAKVFSEEGDGVVKIKGKNNRTIIGDAWKFITQCELWYYVAHLRMNYSGLEKSKELAFQYQGWVSGNSGASNDKVDALRHGIWGTFVGKYGCYRYGSVDEAWAVAYGFIDSHECGETGDGTKMDSHNNFVTMHYYSTVARRHKINFFDYDVVVDKSDEDITNDMINKGFIQVDAYFTGIDMSVDKLIYIN